MFIGVVIFLKIIEGVSKKLCESGGGGGVLGHTGRFVYRKNDNYKSLVYKRAFNIVFKFSENEKINLPHEFIFVFIWYFIGTILSEKSCQKWRVWKNYSGDGHKWRKGVQIFCTL